MSAEDVKPTRLGAAQEAVRRFLAGLPTKYRVGLVTFSSEPFVAAPLTHDRDLVQEGLRYGTVFGRGTASGDALARSVELLQPVATDGDGASSGATPPPPDPDPEGPPSAILLLSDGAQTRGILSPLDGAARAKSYGIPVYAVALGTPGGVINRGGYERPVPPDPATLRQIAGTTGGEFFEIRDQARLNAVYEDLASRLGEKKEWRELSFVLVGLAALFALAAGALSVLWVQRLP
jgi:Ca-activated chloride channel family protein